MAYRGGALMITTTVIVILVALAITEAFHDAALIRWKQGLSDGSAWHLWDSLSWALIFVALGYFAYGTPQGAATVFVAGAVMRLTLFAAFLNMIRGKSPFHLGTTNVVDRFLDRIGVPAAHFVRVCLLVLAGYLLLSVSGCSLL